MFHVVSVCRIRWDALCYRMKKMRELGRKLTGEALQNYEDLKIVLGGGKIISGITKLSEESSVFYLSDNTVWMFQEYMLSESELEGYIQTVAFDISEIYYNSAKKSV